MAAPQDLPSGAEFTSRDDGPPPSKAARLDEAAGDEATPTRKKKRASTSGASSRTGQACDRCKHRKIKCDNTPGGCMPCRQNRSECKTTDRNTNTARVRGHTEAIEQHSAYLQHHIRELHEQLRELGIPPRNDAGYTQGESPYPPPYRHDQYNAQYSASPTTPAAAFTPGQQRPTRDGQREHHLNVFDEAFHPSTSTSPLAPGPFAITSEDLSVGVGSKYLCIFGTKLDLAEFIDMSGGPRSYRSLLGIVLTSASGRTRDYYAELPPYEECRRHVLAFLSVCNAWTPILHAPQILSVVERTYKQGYKATSAELVNLHVCVANILYQTASRNLQDPNKDELDRQADRHFHYALSLVPDLYFNRTLQDIQALTMVCLHLRSFPDHRAAQNIISATLRLAFETGLHRSAIHMPEAERPRDVATLELRKRIFWDLMLFYIPICGKAGLPLPIHPDDFDIEYPQLLDDNLQPAEGGWAEGKCRYFHAVCLMKLCRIFMDMWRLVYAVRRPHNYEQKLQETEVKVRAWEKNEWPAVLKGPAEKIEDPSLRVMAIWLRWWSTELRFYLHHPSRIQGDSSQPLPARKSDDSVKLASTLIQTSVLLWQHQALDTSWAGSLTFVGSIFTLLYCLDRREQPVNPAELTKLRSDLDSCVQILEDIGLMLGSGMQLRDHVKPIIEANLERLRTRDNQRLASAAIAKTNIKSSPSVTSLRDHLQPKQESIHSPQASIASSGTNNHHQQQDNSEYVPASANVFSHQRQPSSSRQHPQQVLSPPGGYQQATVESQYQYPSYSANPAHYPISPSEEQPYIYQNAPPSYHQHASNAYTSAHVDGANGWQHFGVGQEYIQNMEPANALMALQHGDGGPQSTSPVQQGYVPTLMPAGNFQPVRQEQNWPMSTWGNAEEVRGQPQ